MLMRSEPEGGCLRSREFFLEDPSFFRQDAGGRVLISSRVFTADFSFSNPEFLSVDENFF